MICRDYTGACVQRDATSLMETHIQKMIEDEMEAGDKRGYITYLWLAGNEGMAEKMLQMTLLRTCWP